MQKNKSISLDQSATWQDHKKLKITKGNIKNDSRVNLAINERKLYRWHSINSAKSTLCSPDSYRTIQKTEDWPSVHNWNDFFNEILVLKATVALRSLKYLFGFFSVVVVDTIPDWFVTQPKNRSKIVWTLPKAKAGECCEDCIDLSFVTTRVKIRNHWQ